MSIGHVLPHTEHGSGFPIVLLHGMQLDRTLFDPQMNGLCGEYRMVACDLRARTSRGGTHYDFYDLVADLEATLNHLSIERCVLAGMSMGGFTAARAALRISERTAGVVLIGSSCVPHEAEDIAGWKQEFGAVRESETIGVERGRLDSESHFSLRTRLERPDLVNRWAERISRRNGLDTWNELLACTEQDDIRDAFSNSPVPLLLIHGEEDVLVPLSQGLETYKLAQDARLLVLPYAGHAVNLEQPEIVNDAIAAFAREVS